MFTLEEIATEILSEGGFTWDRDIANPTFGHMVATPGNERQVPKWDGSRGVIASYVAEHILTVSESANLWFGAWTEGGTLFLDISENIIERDDAIRVGRLRGEISVWDCENSTTIYL